MFYEILEDVMIYFFTTDNAVFVLGAMLNRNFAL